MIADCFDFPMGAAMFEWLPCLNENEAGEPPSGFNMAASM